jgi:ParB family chromosome partitioning protein
LIPPGAADGVAIPGGGLIEVAVAAIRPSQYQPRTQFDEQGLSELADSIREVGLLQPVLVRPAGDGYELIAGERRWRAARRLGMQTIPCLVRTTDDATALEQALVENVHRAGLNPLEEAAAYQQLIEDFGLTHDEVATRVGRSRASVTNALRLMQLPPAIQRMLQDGNLAAGHARALLGTPDRAFQEQLARRVAKEDLSVRAVEDTIRAREALGATGGPAAARTRASGGRGLRPPGLLELEELLGDHLDTRVTISMRARTGKVVVEFSDLDDLERIYVRMTSGADDPDEQGQG